MGRIADSAIREEVHKMNAEFVNLPEPAPLLVWLYDEAARARLEGRQLRDAVIWMSGSADFAPGGQAHEGWLKIRHLVQK